MTFKEIKHLQINSNILGCYFIHRVTLNLTSAQMQMMQEKSATSREALVEPFADLGRK